MNQIRLRKSASGICSRPSGMTEFSETTNAFTSALPITSSTPPACNSRTRAAPFSTMRPDTVRPSRVSTITFS